MLMSKNVNNDVSKDSPIVSFHKIGSPLQTAVQISRSQFMFYLEPTNEVVPQLLYDKI